MDLTRETEKDLLRYAETHYVHDRLERAQVCSVIAQAVAAERQAAALERIAAAQEKEETWIYNHYMKLDALVGEVMRIAAVLERADNLSKMFEEG